MKLEIRKDRLAGYEVTIDELVFNTNTPEMTAKIISRIIGDALIIENLMNEHNLFCGCARCAILNMARG
jgi:hypothetical protein